MSPAENITAQNLTGENGILYLIPTHISSVDHDAVFPGLNLSIIATLKLFYVENIRSARRFISSLKLNIDISQLRFEVLDKNTDRKSLKAMIDRINPGNNAGLMSEAGNPGVADPGSKLVALAHASGIRVIPLVGPSSILLALVSSGFNGQNFAFNGYLPVREEERKRRIKELEKRMIKEDQTEIFIETPYRNEAMVRTLLDTLNPRTLLAIAAGITGPDEMIKMMPVQDWKKQVPNLHKIPAIFMIYRGNG